VGHTTPPQRHGSVQLVVELYVFLESDTSPCPEVVPEERKEQSPLFFAEKRVRAYSIVGSTRAVCRFSGLESTKI
jgi:hypothetical protein